MCRVAIKTVMFDLGKVIVPFDFRRTYSRMEQFCGIPQSEIAQRIARTGLIDRFETGTIEPVDFARELSAQLDFETTYDDFCDIWSSIFLPETLISEAMVEGIARRFRLLLLSNTNAIHFAMLRRNYPLLRHFHSFVLSYEVGAMKPRPAIYKRAIEEAQCHPEECFFTDDLAVNVEAARSHGIDAVVFESADQVTSELHRRGVAW